MGHGILQNATRYDSDGAHHSAKSNVPGLILEADVQVGESSFLGGAVSISFPDYDQGTLDADGKDYRLSVYGGTLIQGEWELGYFGSIGFGDMKHNRTASTQRLHAKYDVDTYGAGISIARSFALQPDLVWRPFASYEYMHVSTDGYTESGKLRGTNSAAITASKHDENVSRVKLGASVVKNMQSGMYVAGGLYYQRRCWGIKPPQYAAT